mmetsp:Transcript_48281/g.105082  ORF Transcript_48281/g.105082 Transcript_48281/m.105082 type:complete len:238 (+) Transcript_48281:560-1273(+)
MQLRTLEKSPWAQAACCDLFARSPRHQSSQLSCLRLLVRPHCRRLDLDFSASGASPATFSQPTRLRPCLTTASTQRSAPGRYLARWTERLCVAETAAAPGTAQLPAGLRTGQRMPSSASRSVAFVPWPPASRRALPPESTTRGPIFQIAISVSWPLCWSSFWPSSSQWLRSRRRLSPTQPSPRIFGVSSAACQRQRRQPAGLRGRLAGVRESNLQRSFWTQLGHWSSLQIELIGLLS